MASHKKTLVEYKITECAVSTEYAVYDQAYHNIWSKLLMKCTKKSYKMETMISLCPETIYTL